MALRNALLLPPRKGSIFADRKVKIPRALIEEKTQLRTAELAFADSHFARLREGRPKSIETKGALPRKAGVARLHDRIARSEFRRKTAPTYSLRRVTSLGLRFDRTG